MTEETALLWAAALDDVDPRDGYAAAGALVRSSKFMPSIAEVREAANAERRRRAGKETIPAITAGGGRVHLTGLRDMVRQMGKTKHTHKPDQACSTCDMMTYDREILLTEAEPVCLRCGIKHTTAPSCPACGAHHYATRQGSSWLCCYCNTLFVGTTGEWEHPDNAARRAMVSNQREAFLTVYGERYNLGALVEEAAGGRE